MTAKGYRADFAAALTAASCVIGPIIPPSIVMIFYGALMNVSVAALFAGGIVPGLLMAVFLVVYNFWIARRDTHPGGASEANLPAVQTVLRATPALLIPITIVAGIVFGIVTPTEAAAIAVAITTTLVFLYAVLDGASVSKALKSTSALTSASVERTVMLTGSIFMILFAAAVFGYLMGLLRVPEQIAGLVQSAGLSVMSYFMVVSGILFVAGMVMDVSMRLVLLVPVLVPAAIAGGSDHIHVGVVSCLNLTLGLISPPFGGCLMVISAASGVSYLGLSRAILPFLGVQLTLLILLILVPDLTLALPRVLGLIK